MKVIVVPFADFVLPCVLEWSAQVCPVVCMQTVQMTYVKNKMNEAKTTVFIQYSQYLFQ